ncbi:NGFI-A-binding protein 1-like isoform X6 [Argiope bruennichi]|uniref:NGFI-A-binding protein 1 like protein n=1 Tax=Argiope bruennichi TaxID=94029 RepID=A0A8T0FHX7_ARGBR|nr:NGFI-A-binding protein 1-like isoform X6 [Argiope bruennichi]KAF8790854.1 NGFI-A-binding protein 1 like protein [Argiope bruennichi]
MDPQVREFITTCPVPVTPDSGSGPGPAAGPGHGPSPGPSVLPTPTTASVSTPSNRILSRNANGTIAMTSQPTNESELQLYRVLQRANLLSYYDTFICQGGDDVQQLCEAGEEEFLEIMALVGMASKPLHVRRLQKALQEWVNNPAMFQTPLMPAVPPSHSPYPVSPGPPVVRPGPLNLSQPSPVASMQPSPPMPVLSNSNSQSSPSPGAKDASSPQPPSALTFQQALGEYPQAPGSPTSLTPVLVESQIQRLSEAADLLVKTLPQFDPKPQNNKKKICKDLEYVMNMPEDDPRRMDEIRKYAAIYGRFDCKRKPEKPLTLHEVSVNEAAAQICKHIPALLTRRDELFPLARQVVRDSGYQYSKGHSRSQCYSKTFDEDSCKRLRFDGSPGAIPDHNQMEEERKRRQDRLEAVTEQIKLLAGQQHDLKTGLQQSRDTHNVVAVGQIQTQLDLLANQHYQLINEQSELSRQLRRLDRYFTEYRYGIRSSCSENDKIDTDDTDSQFSVYSYESSASIGHDANESPSHDSNMSIQTNDGYSGIKSVQGKKTNSHITKQLVQETLIDEGLRVVKELANQIKDETDMNHVSVSKPEGRPRGRPPRLERDYILTTAGSTTPKHYNDINTNNSRNASTPVTPIQNGHSPTSVGVPSDSENTICHNGILLSLRSNQISEKSNLSNNNSNDGIHMTDMQEEVVSNESESSLKALLAFSQKGIKQEPSSPTSLKMD